MSLGIEFDPIGAFPRGDLARLFDEEASMWARDLSWDFGYSYDYETRNYYEYCGYYPWSYSSRA